MTGEVLSVDAPGRVSFVTEELGEVPEGGFRVETVHSGISAGTELTYVKGTNPYLGASWDPVLGLFGEGRPSVAYPVRGIGYMQAGVVVESRFRPVPEGRRVAMAYGHRTGYVADPLADRYVVLPPWLDPMLGIYVAHMGPICANGLLHAAHDLAGGDVRDLLDGVRGRRVAIVGAGVVGLLVAAFIGDAAEVVMIDETPARLEIAGKLGVAGTSAAEALDLKRSWRNGPGDHGADLVFQCRGQPRALALALKLLRPQGTVVDLAFYTSGAQEVRLGEEFHHNGLSLRCAQIGRVPRGLGHAWNRERLSRETVAMLARAGDLLREHVVTDVVGFGQAPEFLGDLAGGVRQTVQAVLGRDVQDERG
ncbi:zinc-binding alcohol dehydrogenase [Nonomuraea sp. NBC_01738]|uniref:zinc-dependent alcohol dehydrogenase n=1 Tax=Nonomuraea sp. NBC_01738 TaxID=2976003 RepID=UPI002E0F5BF1|nr:zinc-binding alcohol dehydrogenase [Nonomuraea sp. NBC_01738]